MKTPQRKLGSFALFAAALALVLSGCEIAPVGQSEEIANVQTVLAGTPSATPSPTITNTPAPTATHTPTVGPSPTATNTPIPSPTPLPPTPTPNPALLGFSFCDQQAGAAGGRFSARAAEVTASGTPAYEQVVVRFELAEGSAPLGANVSCLSAADFAAQSGVSDLPGAFALRVGLPGWLRDQAFSSSAISGTLSFTGTRTVTGARLIPGDDPDAGAALVIGLTEALPFRLSVERNPTRLVIAVARNSPLVGSSDPLRLEEGSPELAAPLFTIFDGEIWRVERGGGDGGPGLTPGAAGAENLTNSPETETALAVSPDRSTVAFCRAAPGLDPADAELPVPSSLWAMDVDGSNPRQIAQVGVSCADPAFSPDGDTIAFAVDETGATPIQRTIYTVPAAGGRPTRLLEGVDEWSRFAPQWLEDGTLVYAAGAPDGRSTLFLRSGAGVVSDIGAEILVRDGGASYSAVGRPLAAPDGSRLAVELIRDGGLGADLAILDSGGALLELIGAQRTIQPTPTPSPTGTATSAATAAATGTVATAGATAQTTGATGTPAATANATGSPAATARTTGTPAAGSPTAGTTAQTTGLPTAGTTGTPAAGAAAQTTATANPTGTPAATAATATAGTTTPTLTPTLAPTAEPEPEPLPVREGPYWTRPLAWDGQGHLLYLTTRCASQVVQDYQLQRWAGAQRSELLLAGQSLGGIGAASTAGDGLAYVVTEQAGPGPRGPAAATPRSPAALWLWDPASGARVPLLSAERDFTALAP